jgi:hypothetical protein
MLESAKPPPSLIIQGTKPLMIKDGGKNKIIYRSPNREEHLENAARMCRVKKSI